MRPPTVDDVDRIAAVDDPVLRNLRITHGYHRLSRAMGGLTGGGANWCTFATWASKQAGRTIRREDLARALEERLRGSPELAAALEGAVSRARELGARGGVAALRALVERAVDPRAPFERAADAVARGNLKVFQEIGREFARFLAMFAEDTAYDADRMEWFCAALRPGAPPEGQGLLRDAFAAYGRAPFEADDRARAELLLLANVRVGLHEQTRLQPEIAEALDAPLEGAKELKGHLLRTLLPGVWLRIRFGIARLLGRAPLDHALDRIAGHVSREARRVITAELLTLHLPGDEVLRLGRDLTSEFPPLLRHVTNPELRELLARVDPTPDSPVESGAREWADLDERMHFIADFFRGYHERRELFDAPFTPEQVSAMEEGRLPSGRL